VRLIKIFQHITAIYQKYVNIFAPNYASLFISMFRAVFRLCRNDAEMQTTRTDFATEQTLIFKSNWVLAWLWCHV